MSEHEEEIEVIDEKDSHREGFSYTHPSFGMISVSRMSSSHGERLFGSEIKTNNMMRIEIGECKVSQDLGKNWYFQQNTLTEVIMTPVQYAATSIWYWIRSSACPIFRRDCAASARAF